MQGELCQSAVRVIFNEDCVEKCWDLLKMSMEGRHPRSWAFGKWEFDWTDTFIFFLIIPFQPLAFKQLQSTPWQKTFGNEFSKRAADVIFFSVTLLFNSFLLICNFSWCFWIESLYVKSQLHCTQLHFFQWLAYIRISVSVSIWHLTQTQLCFPGVVNVLSYCSVIIRLEEK